MTQIRKPLVYLFLVLLVTGLTVSRGYAQTRSLRFDSDIAATAHPYATHAAISMYRKGGNAIDAAVAAAFVLGVVEPHNSGLGGGGFMMIYLAQSKKIVILDYREVAPLRVNAETYRHASSTKGYQAAAVPGQAMGLALAQREYGRFALGKVMQAAIRFAERGFQISTHLAKRLKARSACLDDFAATRAIFFKKGRSLRVGERLLQNDLAKTLTAISTDGPDAFYRGSVAQDIVTAMATHGGLITQDDLASYKVKPRKPLSVPYKGYDIVTMPPPSSGGILFSQMFHMLAQDPLGDWGWANKREAHLLTEVMKLAYRDRARYLGDADFSPSPRFLTSEEYARTQRQRISFSSVLAVEKASEVLSESENTTHASFADRWGNIVVMTNSLNLAFGSCAVVEGTGILMNNEMDDFATRPGKPNAFGLIQGTANEMLPGKRPLSSMTPTIVFKNNEPVFALGTPGGPTIISNIFQVLINLIDHRMTLHDAVTKPKLHHQYLPDHLLTQRGYPKTTKNALRRLGHHIKERDSWGNMQAIRLDYQSGKLSGISDPRGMGLVRHSRP